MNELEWKLFEELMPQSLGKRGRGMSHAAFRQVLNTHYLRANYWLQMVSPEANNGSQKVLTLIYLSLNSRSNRIGRGKIDVTAQS